MQNDSIHPDGKADGIKSRVDDCLKRINRLDYAGEYESAILEARDFIDSIKQEAHGDSSGLVNFVQKEIIRLEQKIRFRDESLKSQKKDFILNFILPLAVAVPGVLLSIGALIMNHSLWKPCVMVSRGGFFKGVPAYGSIIMLAVFMVIYALSFSEAAGDFLGGWAGLRGASVPSEGEKTIAVWFLRLILLALLYFSAFGNMRAI